MAAVGATECLRLLQGIISWRHWDTESEPWLEFASKRCRKKPKHWKKQSMVGEEELLGHFLPRTFPFCFVLRLFCERRMDVFPSLISYSVIVSLLLPAAEITGLAVIFKTSFPFNFFNSVSSQPLHMFHYKCALVQETAKIPLPWGHPITM